MQVTMIGIELKFPARCMQERARQTRTRGGWTPACYHARGVIRMIRILAADEPSCTTITVDGQLSSDGVALVEICCDMAASRGNPVQLFLRDVSVIDEEGRALLRRLAHRGIGLRASGIYCSYVIGLISPQKPEA
jgi:hypothetical protein